MTQFQREPEVGTSSMSLRDLSTLVRDKLREIVAAKHADVISQEILDAIKEKLTCVDVGDALLVERKNYALSPTPHGQVVLVCDTISEVMRSVSTNKSNFSRRSSSAVCMNGTPPGNLSENLCVWLPRGYVELDRTAARCLADALAGFASTGRIS